jgi:undecaprenyl-diphosphatase
MKKFVDTLVGWGPLGLLVIAFLDGMGVPLPGGVDLALILLCTADPAQAYWYALVTIGASLAGGMVLYYVARKGGEAFLAKYTSSGRGAKFRVWFQHYGLITVFIPALVIIPMPLKVFVICAGALGVTPRAFFLTLLVARIPRYFGLAYLGSQLGTQSWPWVKAHVWHMVGLAGVLCAALYLMIRLADARRQRLAGGAA